MYVYEYLSLQRELEDIKNQLTTWKPMGEHLKLITRLNVTIIKIKNLKLISNN